LSSGVIFARFKVGGKQVKESVRQQIWNLPKANWRNRGANERGMAQERRQPSTGPLRDEHSQEMAQKVFFSEPIAKLLSQPTLE
jgi:hypothetical protein